MLSTTSTRFRGTDLSLVADAVGPESGPLLLFLHGSGQTRQSWRRAIATGAELGYRCISLDLRGHGDSDWSPDGIYTVERFVDDIAAIIDQLDAPGVAIIGASLGGIVGMHLAGEDSRHPVSALVLVDITPQPERAGAQEVMAFMNSAPDGFASLDEAADAVSAYLPHRERPSDPSGLLRNLRERNGRYYWHWDPAFLALGRDARWGEAEISSPFVQAARTLRVPTLLVRGSRSRIVSEEGVRAFLDLVPHAEYEDIAGAHHMVAGDANDAFNDAVFAFLARAMPVGMSPELDGR